MFLQVLLDDEDGFLVGLDFVLLQFMSTEFIQGIGSTGLCNGLELTSGELFELFSCEGGHGGRRRKGLKITRSVGI